MPDTKAPLPVRCPQCLNEQSTLTIFTRTVLTVTCAGCHHSWSIDVGGLPSAVREAAVNAALAMNDGRS